MGDIPKKAAFKIQNCNSNHKRDSISPVLAIREIAFVQS